MPTVISHQNGQNLCRHQYTKKEAVTTQTAIVESAFLPESSKSFTILGEEQAGFRENHSTADKVFILYTLITKYHRHKGGRFYALFVDCEKAFDHVDRSALWHKLLTQNISSKMVHMLNAIYADVKTCIKTAMGLTDCPIGVRQGCIISPVMFTLFLNNLQEYVSLDSHGIDIKTITLFVLPFADDLVIFAATGVELQRMINCLRNYCNL